MQGGSPFDDPVLAIYTTSFATSTNADTNTDITANAAAKTVARTALATGFTDSPDVYTTVTFTASIGVVIVMVTSGIISHSTPIATCW